MIYRHGDWHFVPTNKIEGEEVSKTVAECMSWAMSNEDLVVTPKEWELMIPLVNET